MARFFKIVFKTGFICFLIGAIGVTYYFSKHDSWQINMVSYNKQFTIDASKVTSIDIDADRVDVTLTANKQDEIVAQLIGEVNEKKQGELVFQPTSTPDGTLHLAIDVEYQKGFLFGSAHDLHLQIFLPQKVYENMNIRTSAGDLQIGNVEAKNGSFKSAAGDIMINNFHGDQLKISSTTGDILLTQTESKTEVNTQTGDVVVRTPSQLKQDLAIETATGDISVSLKEQPSAAEIKLQTNTGDVATDLPNLAYREQEEHRIVGSIGTGGPKLDLSSSTGDITVSQAQ